ncbi:hypothetical protein PIB30_075528 [Stylosanthes scabra]|uniref:Uncharacterized protein n=1 Tax=Stylosanthes scabra TaxID=79078 RepID=A0ABU6QQ53_9FABA|nr:hypothetical protein [Stylosanthes scabra]
MRAMKEDVPDWAKWLARGPNRVVKRFLGYVINGYRFHTRHHDARHKTQNSGVTLEALTSSFALAKDKNPIEAKVTYYANGVNNQEIKQPIRIEEDSCKDQHPKLKKRKIQPMSLFQEREHNNGNPLGIAAEKISEVHGIDLDNEEDEDEVYNNHVEDAENEEGNGANPNGNGKSSNNQGAKKKYRGKTTCSKIHNTAFSDRKEVELFCDQPIGPTTDVKKFILHSSSKEWVMGKLRGAWKKYKGEVKKFHFKKYRTKKEMLKNRPLEIY